MVKLVRVGTVLLAAASVMAWAATDEPAAPQKDAKVNEGKLPATYRGLPLLWIPKRPAPDKLTGALDHASWKEGAKVTMKRILDKGEPKHKTEVTLFCTGDALYFGFKCFDPKPDALKLDPEAIWSRDEIEIFIEPFKNTIRRAYHQILIDGAGEKSASRHHMYPKAQMNGISEQWAPEYEVAAGKDKESWMIEVKLPFEQMVLSEDAKQKKTLWRLNVNRCRPERDTEEAMEAAWSPTENKSFHTATKFGFAVPETHASPELLEAIWKEAAEVQRESAGLSPELSFEMRKRIGELGSEVFTERDEALDRLKNLAGLSQPAYMTLEAELQEAMARSREQEVVAHARRLLGEIKVIKQKGELNDDTLPDHLQAFER